MKFRFVRLWMILVVMYAAIVACVMLVQRLLYG